MTIPAVDLRRRLLTNSAFGYPRGEVRRVEPIALACVHVTANPQSPPATAEQERNHANRANSNGPSAHVYVDRADPYGASVQAIEPVYAAWSNGALRSPRVAVPGVQAVVDLAASGLNPNEAYAIEIEICGRYPDYPITPEQIDVAALLIAREAVGRGMPVERRTVHLHSDLDTVNRPNCPVPAARREDFAAQVIERAEMYATVLGLLGQVDDLSARLEEVEAVATERGLKLDEWRLYADQVASHVGAALAIDRPT